jgi:hypothetical protein
MNVIGIDDEAERAHELAELGPAAEQPGPLCSLAKARSFDELRKLFSLSLVELNERVARARPDDPKLAYYRSLLILTKKVELDVQNQLDVLTRLNRELDELHEFVHELYPAE